MDKPDIVVGIDVGQTGSAVAYSIGPDWSEPHALNRWPSSHGIEKTEKVATRVGYSKVGGKLKNWGFKSDFGDSSVLVREQFKLTCDSEYEDDRGFTSEHARQWYSDFLCCLHGEIENSFEATIPRWRDLRVEYSFSTPTTWKNPAMVASIEKLIREAGFANTRQKTVRMGLTEAEAAAIEACTTQYRVGDVFLICDAGGGTTDVNLLKVKSIDPRIELEPLDHVEGEPIGSTLIDYSMARHIVGRLEPIRNYLEGDPQLLAEEMLMGRFQTIKHSFPSPVVPDFKLDVAGLAGIHSFPDVDIHNSKMVIQRETLEEMFDQQIRRMFSLIDDRLLEFQAAEPHEQVSYIILSGGLGSSPYLQERLRQRYEKNVGFRSDNTTKIRVMKVQEPQLAVVRGLVRERTQRLGKGRQAGDEVFRTRRCRNSYGVETRTLYDEARHRGSKFIVDPLNRRRYIENTIDWFILKGQVIDVSTGIQRQYYVSLAAKQTEVQRSARIVMSSLPVGQLPVHTTHPGCKDVVLVDYTLPRSDMRIMNGKLWSMGRKYFHAAFSFVVNLGPADIKFQVVGRDGVLSVAHDHLEVQYMDPSEHSPPLPRTGDQKVDLTEKTARSTSERIPLRAPGKGKRWI